MCPFCEWGVRPDSSTPNVDRAEHITTFHVDRLRACTAYERAIKEGLSVEAARVRYHKTLRAGGPGSYDRDVRTTTQLPA